MEERERFLVSDWMFGVCASDNDGVGGFGGSFGGREGGGRGGGRDLQDVYEVCVDEVRGVDCEDGAEGGGGGVGRGAVDGHGVDFVGDEVDAVALAEAHVCF